MPTHQLYHNDFNSSALATLAGNGSSFIENGVLVGEVPTGVQSNWLTASPWRQGVVAYHGITSYVTDNQNSILIFETELARWEADSSNAQWWFMLYKDDNDWNMIYSTVFNQINGYRNTANSWNAVGSQITGLTRAPRIRFVWTPAKYDVHGNSISYPHLSYQYRRESDNKWTEFGWTQYIPSGTPPFNSVMFSTRNYSEYPHARAEWSFLNIWSIEQTGYDDRYIGQQYGRLLAGDKTSGYEDKASVLTQQGPQKWTAADGQGAGYLMPGPPSQEIMKGRHLGPRVQSGFEDKMIRIPDAGGATQYQAHESPEYGKFGTGVRLPNSDRFPSRAGARSIPLAAWEDRVVHLLSESGAINSGTFDQWGNNHQASGSMPTAWIGKFFDTSNDPWSKPTENSFTGFGRDGKHYTAGVQDAGPVLAPWAAEGQNVNRSPRQDFPERFLLIIHHGEGLALPAMTIYDCDSFDGSPSSLIMWMRFYASNNANWGYIGSDDIYYMHRDLSFANGCIAVAHQWQSNDHGGIFVIDFKRDGDPDAAWILRSSASGPYRLYAGVDLTQRNHPATVIWDGGDLGGAPDIHLTSEYYYRVECYSDGDNLWVVGCGEDAGDPTVVYFEGGSLKWIVAASGDAFGPSDAWNYWQRNIFIDSQGWLWHSDENRLFRNPAAWRQGYVRQWNDYGDSYQSILPYRVDLPHNIYWLAEARDHIYAATDVGVYKISRIDLSWYLAYTIEGYGGEGRIKGGNTGAILAGKVSRPYKIDAFDTDISSYLCVPSTGYGSGLGVGGHSPAGVSCIRLTDDKVIMGKTQETGLPNDGAYLNIPIRWKV